MRRLAAGVLLGAVALAPAAPAAADVPLAELWYGVQRSVQRGAVEELSERVGELRRAARSTGAERLSTYAAALAMWARTHRGTGGEAALAAALELDRRCAEARWLQARWAWEEGRYGAATVALARGVASALADPWTRRDVAGSLVVWFALAAVAAGLVWMTLAAGRYLPEVLHDGMELGRTIFSPANAWVFAVALAVLPLLAGLGPVWLVAYLLGLALPYMRRREVAAALVAWLVATAAVPAVELWKQRGLVQPSPLVRAVTALDSGIVDTMLLDELLGLAPELRGKPSYHMLAGELLHLHGELAGAHEQMRLVTVYAPERPDPHIWLGNIALEEGDVGLAIQQFGIAVEKDPRSAVAHYNLSVALDQAHLFERADEARSRASALGIANADVAYRSVDGMRIAYPRDQHRILADLRASLNDAQRVALGLVPPPLSLREGLASPFTLAVGAPVVLGLVLLGVRRAGMPWRARSCLRCGKVFCERCKTSTESQAYCTQCISVFLKRDAVALDQQAAKLQQIRRHEARRRLVRRVLGTVLPGAGAVVAGAPWRGLLLLLGAALGVTGLLVWLPGFAPAVAGSAPLVPVRLALLAWLALVWAVGIRWAWREA